MTEKAILEKIIARLSCEPSLNSRYKATIDKFLRKLAIAKIDKYRIGVIGVTSSGKSTLINAVLGDELLSMAIKPSSSQLVSCSKSDNRKATVYFENKNPVIYEGGLLTPEIIKKYTDENYNTKNRERVKQVELSTPKFSFPDDTLLIDSPGLDAFGLDMHEKLTLNSLLPTIHFCVFVTTFKTNSDEKMRSVLDTIAGYNCPVIIIQNMLDSVKASPDGKKSVIDVANEHKVRVERIVNASKIECKSSVKIVQISSKMVLNARLKNDEAEMSRWGYFNLIDAVSATLEEIKPQIERNRYSGIKRDLADIIDQAEQDMKSDSRSLANLKFKFEGLDDEIQAEFKRTENAVERPLSEIQAHLAALSGNDDERSSSFLGRMFISIAAKLNEDFCEDDVKVINELVSSNENKILETMSGFNRKISCYCKMLGEDEHQIRTVESFGAVPELKIHNKKVDCYKEKTGGPFGGRVARWFSNKFGTDWGWKKVTKDEFDSNATKKAAIEYLKNVVFVCSGDCEKWYNSAQSVVNQLCGIIENLREENEARKAVIPDKNAMIKMIEGLKAVMYEIPEIKISSGTRMRHTQTDLEIHFDSLEISNEVFGIYTIAKRLKSRIHYEVMNEIRRSEKLSDKFIVVAWDKECLSLLLNNLFGIEYSDERIIFYSEDVYAALNPKQKTFRLLRNKLSDEMGGVNFIVLFNATQYGEALNTISKSGLLDEIRSVDKLFFAAQDFEELENGGNITEAVRNMLDAKETLKINVPYKILVNSVNPIYNLAVMYAQSSDQRLLSDEVDFLGEIRRRFGYLIDTFAERAVSDIFKAFQKG